MSPLELHQLLARCLTVSPAELRDSVTRDDFPWPGLLEIANRTYLAPALYIALVERAQAELPADVRSYLTMLAQLNSIRNKRLKSQAHELITALNESGVVPLLLKGAAVLFSSSNAPESGRMVTDLDILVRRDEAPAALMVLQRLGYRLLLGRGTSSHTLGDFARERDVGAVDLHIELITTHVLFPAADALARSPRRQIDGLQVQLLPASDQVLHLLLHDLVQDQGFHDGRLNFRHLHELAMLMRGVEPIHWAGIRAHLARFHLELALHLWLLAVEVFFAAPRVASIPRTVGARILFWRATMLLRYPGMARASEIFGNVHRSLARYRLAERDRRLPRLRQSLRYIQRYRARAARQLVHVLLYRRS